MTFSLNPTKCNCSTSRNRLLLFKHPSIDRPPHPAKRSITVNFFKFRSSFMRTIAIFKSFIINYIYYIHSEQPLLSAIANIRKFSENQTIFFFPPPSTHASHSPLSPIILPNPPLSRRKPTIPDSIPSTPRTFAPSFKARAEPSSLELCRAKETSYGNAGYRLSKPYSVRCTCRISYENTQLKFNLKKKGKTQWQKFSVSTPKSAAR